MKKVIAIIIVVALLCFYAFLIVKYIENHVSLWDAEFGSFLAGIFAPLSAVGTILVSYYIYRVTSMKSRADMDLKLIIETYQRIAEAFELLKQSKEDRDSNMAVYYERKLKVDSILMLNLIKRYPRRTTDFKKIETNLYGINVNPNHESEYKELAENMQNFCYELDSEIIKNEFSYTIK